MEEFGQQNNVENEETRKNVVGRGLKITYKEYHQNELAHLRAK